MFFIHKIKAFYYKNLGFGRFSFAHIYSLYNSKPFFESKEIFPKPEFFLLISFSIKPSTAAQLLVDISKPNTFLKSMQPRISEKYFTTALLLVSVCFLILDFVPKLFTYDLLSSIN